MIEKETKTVQRKQEKTFFKCDWPLPEGCDVRSPYQGDFIYVGLNISYRQLHTGITKNNIINRDGLIILCEKHYDEFRTILKDEMGFNTKNSQLDVSFKPPEPI